MHSVHAENHYVWWPVRSFSQMFHHMHGHLNQLYFEELGGCTSIELDYFDFNNTYPQSVYFAGILPKAVCACYVTLEREYKNIQIWYEYKLWHIMTTYDIFTYFLLRKQHLVGPPPSHDHRHQWKHTQVSSTKREHLPKKSGAKKTLPKEPCETMVKSRDIFLGDKLIPPLIGILI